MVPELCFLDTHGFGDDPDMLYEASMDFLRQHLSRKFGKANLHSSNSRQYSDTLLFEVIDEDRPELRFVQLRNVDEFDRKRDLETKSSMKTDCLSAEQLIPNAESSKSRIARFFRTKSSPGKRSTSGRSFLGLLKKLTPKSSKQSISSVTPSFESNSSFPSIIATNPKCSDDSGSYYIVTNVWPQRDHEQFLQTTNSSSRENLNVQITFSDNDMADDEAKTKVLYVKKQQSKISVCSETCDSTFDDDYVSDDDSISTDFVSTSSSNSYDSTMSM